MPLTSHKKPHPDAAKPVTSAADPTVTGFDNSTAHGLNRQFLMTGFQNVSVFTNGSSTLTTSHQ